jgi:hypothetical protein
LDSGADTVLAHPLDAILVAAQVRAATRIATVAERVAKRAAEARILGDQPCIRSTRSRTRGHTKDTTGNVKAICRSIGRLSVHGLSSTPRTKRKRFLFSLADHT